MRVETWKHMATLLKSRAELKAIGVSNFSEKQIEGLEEEAKMLPAVNQFEMHPFCKRTSLIDFCHRKNIIPQVYGVFGCRDDSLLENETIKSIAAKRNLSEAAVLLLWAKSKNVCILFGSTKRDNIEANYQILQQDDSALTPEDLQEIDQIEEKCGTKVFGWKGVYDLDSVDVANKEWGDTW
jgi:diketogulonate reductase-like aldo/keto reductase